MDVAEHNFETSFFYSDDSLRLYYRDYRTNTEDRVPVVCLHGLTRNSQDFEDIAGHLAQKRRVIVPDFRGRGLSEYDEQWQNYHPHTYVNDTWRLLSHLNLNRVIILGTSLGGLVAMIMASQKPHMLQAVILNDIGPQVAPGGLERIRSYLGNVRNESRLDDAVNRAKEINQDFFPDFRDKYWRRFVLRTYKVNAKNLYELAYDPNIVLALNQLGGLPEDPWQYFNALKPLPCLLIHGGLSDLLTADIVGKMRLVKPDLQYAMISRCGHAPVLNEPESIRAIDSFLATLS